jgi:hypothetical protein
MRGAEREATVVEFSLQIDERRRLKIDDYKQEYRNTEGEQYS